MKIDPELCVSCGTCLVYCPLGAIKMKDVAEVDQAICTDCGDCFRTAGCPSNAITVVQAPWPRSVRAAFSNVLVEHRETRVPGRGTEEMKTNDVRGLFGKGIVGMGCELGRPGISTSFKDVEKVCMALAKVPGISFAEGNPVTANMVDKKTGKLNPEMLNERSISAIVECKVPIESLPVAIQTAKAVAKEIDTVFSIEFIYRPEANRTVPIKKILDEQGVTCYPNGKFNLGLGRPLVP